jgi:Zn-dependent protease
MTGGLSDGAADVLALVIFFNLLLGVFNLIPLAPLDGSRVLAGLVPREHGAAYARLQRNGPAVLVGIVMLDFALGFGILWGIIGPVVRTLTTAATGY